MARTVAELLKNSSAFYYPISVMPTFDDIESFTGKAKGFGCREPLLDTHIKQWAKYMDRNGYCKTYVIRDAAENRIRGYVTLNASSVHKASLPDDRSAPTNYPTILLGRLAVDVRDERQGLGTRLVQFALHKALEISEQIGVTALEVQALNERAQHMYQKMGFQPYIDDANHMYISIATLAKAREAAGQTQDLAEAQEFPAPSPQNLPQRLQDEAC